MKWPNDFDQVASTYDLLVWLVFGNRLEQAYSYYLSEISMDSHVLIVGGGTGKILKRLEPGIFVDYVDNSGQMLARSVRYAGDSTSLIHADYLMHDPARQYDYIIFPFFLDLFASSNLERIIEHAKGQLKPEGKLIVTDFQPTRKWRHKLLIRAMHLFFRIFARYS